MALQWTPLRLMVSENGGPQTRPELGFSHLQLRSRTKMTDRAVQCDEDLTDRAMQCDGDLTGRAMQCDDDLNCTVAEINSPETGSTPPRPLSIESTNSFGRERRRTMCEDMDEIVVQPLPVETLVVNLPDETNTRAREQFDGIEEPDNGNENNSNSGECCVDCLYYTCRFCECRIL